MRRAARREQPIGQEYEPIPRQIEEYRLVRPLGKGAMGEVFLAEDTALGRLVAIKVARGQACSERGRARFLNEARALARIQSPNVVAIHRVGALRGRPYLVSEYVPGAPLDTVPRPLPTATLQSIVRGLTEALSAAHRKDIIHRDVKPANVMLTEDGTVKLLDFGLAEIDNPTMQSSPKEHRRKAPPLRAIPSGDATISLAATASIEAPSATPHNNAAPSASPPTESGPRYRFAGTPLYLAPELWSGEKASIRSDLYSLGATLYELATGEAPFSGVDVADLQEAKRAQEVPSVRKKAPHLPAPLATAIDQCLSKDPSQRPASAEAFLSLVV